jgi:hypothetical protein
MTKAEEFYKQRSNSIRELWVLSPKQIEYIALIMQEYAALRQPPVSGRSLRSEFWKESADLIEKYRGDGDERAAQGVVSCRILIDRLMKQLDNSR